MTQDMYDTITDILSDVRDHLRIVEDLQATCQEELDNNVQLTEHEEDLIAMLETAHEDLCQTRTTLDTILGTNPDEEGDELYE